MVVVGDSVEKAKPMPIETHPITRAGKRAFWAKYLIENPLATFLTSSKRKNVPKKVKVTNITIELTGE